MAIETNKSKLLPGNGLVDGVLDEIIPAGMNNQIPSAGSLEISRFLEEICSEDEEVAKILHRGFALCAKLVDEIGSDFATFDKDQRVAIVKQLEAEDLEFFTSLLRFTYMGYYSRGDVRKSLGLSELPVHPRGYAVAEESSELMESLTATVRGRAECYRA